ncbi:MAG: tetratricopeptide repeat protein [Planctomycetota bacterium]
MRKSRLRTVAGLSLGLIASVTTLSAAQPTVSTPGLRSLRSAHGLLQRGLHELAVGEYRAALDAGDLGESEDDARYGLAVAHFRLGEFERSLEELDELEDLETDDFQFDADAAMLRGHALFRLARYGEAGEAFESACATFSRHSGAPAAAALSVEALGRAGRHRQAVRAYERFAEIVPEGSSKQRMAFFRAVSLSALGEHEDAAGVFERLATTADGAIADRARLRAAQSFRAAGRDADALRRFRDAAANGTEATAPPALLGSAVLGRAAGDLEDASAALRRLREAYPDHQPARVAYESGLVSLEQDEPSDAASFFESAGEIGLDASLRDRLTYWRSKAELRRGDPVAAAALLRDGVESYGDSELAPEMAFDLGVALDRAGDDQAALEAFADFGRRFESHPLAADALRAEASLALATGDAERAAELAARFGSRYPAADETAEVSVLLAEARYREGDFEGSVAALRGVMEPVDRVAERLGDNAYAASYRYGMALRRLERDADAEPWLARVEGLAGDEASYRPALLALGEIAFDRGEYGVAEPRLVRYLELGENPADADDALLLLGLCRARREDHRAAIDALARIAREHPQSEHLPQAAFEIGQSLVAVGDDARASSVFERLLESSPGSRFEPFIFRHLGAIAMRAGEPEEAADWLARAAAAGADLDATSLALDRGRALLSAGQPEAAAEALRDSAGPGAPELNRAWYGVALSRSGDAEEAARTLEAIDLDELDGELASLAGYELAVSLRQLGRDGDAEMVLRGLVSRGSAGAGAHAALDLATLLIGQGELEEGVTLLEPLIASSASTPSELCAPALYQCAWALAQLSRHERAAALLDPEARACDLGDLTGPSELVYGESLLAIGRAGAAADRLAIAADRASDAGQRETALLRLGEAAAQAQRWDDSREAFAAHREEFGDGPLWFRSRFGLGWAIENGGDPAAAIEHYREVATRHDGATAARAQFQIGECLFAMGRHEEAARELLRVDILFADTEWSPAAIYEAGRAFEAMNKVGEARQQYRDVRGRYPDSDWARLASERLSALGGGPRSRGGSR